MADKKTITINGNEYASKSNAIRALLVEGVKKSDIAKQTESHYSFVVTVERKMLADATPEADAARVAKEEAKAAKAAEKEKLAKERAEKKAARDKERAEKKAATEAERAEKKAMTAIRIAVARNAANADRVAKLKKAVKITASKGKGKGAKVTNKQKAKINSTITEEEEIEAALAFDAEIPADIAADMAADGLID